MRLYVSDREVLEKLADAVCRGGQKVEPGYVALSLRRSKLSHHNITPYNTTQSQYFYSSSQWKPGILVNSTTSDENQTDEQKKCGSLPLIQPEPYSKSM
jgi:hypothetical protein